MRLQYCNRVHPIQCAANGRKRNPRTDQKQKQSHSNQKPNSRPASTTIDNKDDILQCRHFAECSGCTLTSSTLVPLPPSASHVQQTIGLEKINIGEIHGWRRRARLAVRRDKHGQPAVGLFQTNSHEITDIPDCKVHHPLINKVADTIRQILRDKNLLIRPYDESTEKGQLRYVELTVVDALNNSSSSNANEEQQQLVQVVLVWNADSLAAAAKGGINEFSDLLWNAHNTPIEQQQQSSETSSNLPKIHSIWANFNSKQTNTIFAASRFRLLRGSLSAWITYGNTRICIDPPGSFMQANVQAMTHALDVIRQYVPQNAAVVDLYGGVGTIGLSLLHTNKLSSLKLVEVVESGKLAFEYSLKYLIMLQEGEKGGGKVELPDSPESVEYIVSDASGSPNSGQSAGVAQKWFAKADVVIVDPPRKGLAPELLQILCCCSNNNKTTANRKSGVLLPKSVHRLIYLSCGYKAFERDCQELLKSGNWVLRHTEGFVFFPGSDHIESLAVLDRVI